MNTEIADKIYDILVAECGATEDWRTHFIYSTSQRYPSIEYRFQGALGFGGKFWTDRSRWYVNCYSEDETPERATMIERTNGLLAKLREEMNQ
jgi:hypothetical protein